jgi:hypothetical protein
MAAFWAAFSFGGSGPAITAHGSLDLKQEIQIQSSLLTKTSFRDAGDGLATPFASLQTIFFNQLFMHNFNE